MKERELLKYYYEIDYCSKEHFYLHERTRVLVNYFNRFINKGAFVLDVGGNKGQLLIRLPKKHVKICLDNSMKTFEKRIKSENLFFVLGDASRLPFKDNCFDAVVCSEVLEHLPKPDLALREINRILKVKGKLFVSVPNLVEAYGWIIYFFRVITNPKKLFKKRRYTQQRKMTRTNLFSPFVGHLHIKTPSAWENLIRKTGFKIRLRAGILMLPLRHVIYQTLGKKFRKQILRLEDKNRERLLASKLSNGLFILGEK